MTSLERLNFANGQRLVADDLRLEQHYHIAVRRMLNRGLFTPGVVNGLEVAKKEQPTPNPRQVVVLPGLALDPQGRELFVADPVDVAVPNQPPLNPARGGYFLVIRYGEETMPGSPHPCEADGRAPEPARIVERPRLEWTEDWPDHAQCGKPTGRPLDCAIPIALVTLDGDCKVAGIETAFRQYAYPAHLSQVQALALEGEKDIDKDNPKVLHFQVRGGTPSSVTLYLWGAKFSTLYYTELGKHTHTLATETGPATTSLAAHTHSLSAHTHSIPDATPHRHRIKTEPTAGDKLSTHTVGGGGTYHDRSRPPILPFIEDTAVTFGGPTGGPSTDSTGNAIPTTGQGTETHTHSIPAIAVAGVTDLDARSGPNEKAHTYLNDLRVELDGVDITNDLVTRFVPSWQRLGNGNASDPINASGGTGPLSLLALGRRIDQGPHTIKLGVPAGGGKVLYNLYVA